MKNCAYCGQQINEFLLVAHRSKAAANYPMVVDLRNKGFKYSEISRQLDISEPMVGRLIKRAKRERLLRNECEVEI